ncbi:2-methylene-furan-3-one reductase [Phytophthora citrophthora]|uniref:2-methylene-furan-3-one reductase n=1 Tax=Phytophthora citrophthora TaxID=4793 RepID=A0AAD9LDL0_9STRA|nr:2-methylene-furan-3-one reductase [Phytophthora citrophthora]
MAVVQVVNNAVIAATASTTKAAGKITNLPANYRAYQYSKYGSPDVELNLQKDVRVIPLEPTQLRVKVHSAALNPADQKVMQDFGLAVTGRQPSADKPFGMGFDVAGTVVETGNNANQFKVGDAVFAMAPYSNFGTFAEFVAIDEQFVALKPANVTFEEAASIPYAALTSYQALCEHANLKAGERVLVLGGSTATGIAAIQLARAMGVYVITTVRGCQDYLLVQSLGVDKVIDASKQSWVDVVDEHSVDVVYDCGVERKAWNRDAQTVLKKDTGRFVTINPMMQPRPAKFGAKCIGEIMVHASGAQLKELSRFVSSGALKPVIDSVYSFDQLLLALEKLKMRKVCGKIVLNITH